MADITLISTLTAAVSVLANEYLKGFAGETGKQTWQSIKSLFGWSSEPSIADIAPQVADKLQSSPELIEQLLKLLQSDTTENNVKAMVGQINAEKVIVANKIETQNFIM